MSQLPRSARGRTTVIGPSKVNPLPINLDPATWEGGWAYFEDGTMQFSDGTRWVNTINSIDQNLEVTVGAGGDYATLGEAISYFAGLVPASVDASVPYLGRILILAGTVMREQVFAYSVDLSWVIIESQDATVNVDRAFLVEQSAFIPIFPFLEFNSSSAPVVNTYFVATGGSIPTLRTAGLVLRGSSFVSQADPALNGLRPPTSFVFTAGFAGFTENIRAAANSLVRLDSIELRDPAGGASAAQRSNLFCSSASVSFLVSRMRGHATAGGRGLVAAANSIVVTAEADCENAATVPTVDDLVIDNGSRMVIIASTHGGTTGGNIAPTARGDMFDGRVTTPPVFEGYSKLPSFTVAGLPSAATLGAGTMLYVSNESGGAVPAFSDGTNWRRVTDRAIVS